MGKFQAYLLELYNNRWTHVHAIFRRCRTYVCRSLRFYFLIFIIKTCTKSLSMRQELHDVPTCAIKSEHASAGGNGTHTQDEKQRAAGYGDNEESVDLRRVCEMGSGEGAWIGSLAEHWQSKHTRLNRLRTCANAVSDLKWFAVTACT